MKEIHVLLPVKKIRKKRACSIDFKDTEFVSDDFQLLDKDKRSRVKSDKDRFVDQVCLGKSKIVLYKLYYDYVTPKWGKKML